MKFQTENKLLSAFNYSSLTDIVMLLLTFFLLTSQFVMITGVQVKLPKSSTSESLNENQLIVTINKQNEIYIGTEKISLDMLGQELMKNKTESKLNNLVIKADKDVPIDVLVKVIDVSRGIGIVKFTLATEKEQK